MDHETAIRLQAAERYVSGELSETERDQFEEHFFDCADCAEEVRWEQVFAANARAVFREETSRPPAAATREWVASPRRFGNWFSLEWLRPAFAASAFANAALLLLGGYQVLQVSHLRARLASAEAPQLTAAIVVPTLVRSEPKLIQAPPSLHLIPLSFALPRQYPEYAYELSREGGSTRYSQAAAAPTTSAEELLLSIPTTRLEAGIYRVVLFGIEGGARTEIGSCRLQVLH